MSTYASEIAIRDRMQRLQAEADRNRLAGLATRRPGRAPTCRTRIRFGGFGRKTGVAGAS